MFLIYSDLVVIALIVRGIRRGVTLSGIRAMLVCPTVLLCRRSATVVLLSRCCCLTIICYHWECSDYGEKE